MSLPAFPSVRPDNDAVVASLSGGSFALQPCGDSDIPFLRALYRQTREVELALTGWPEAMKVAFADNQFDLQHRHFVSHFSRACFLRLQQDDEHVGRYYLDIAPDVWHIIDIAILANRRGQGLGSDLLRRTLAIAPAVTLMVATNNPAAMRLYARLGFVDDGEAGSMHRRMRRAS